MRAFKLTFKVSRAVLALCTSVAVWGVNAAPAQAQFGGLQIQIGGGGGYYGSGYSGIGIPFGVGPSIPLSSRAYMGPAYGLGYRSYYGYSAIPVPGAVSVGVFGVAPYDYAAPSYRGYSSSSGYYNTPNYNSSGPYSGSGVSNYQQQFDLYQQQLQAEQSELHSSQGSSSYRPNYRSTAPAIQAGNDLRPGMVLPDGSTVLSVGPLSASDSAGNSSGTAAKPQANVIPTTPPPTPRRSNRAAF